MLWLYIACSAVFEDNIADRGGDNWVDHTSHNPTLWLTVAITLRALL
jgi:hypothetical protein